MEPHSHGAAPGASTWSRTRCPQGPSWYLLEQKSDTTNPERHFLQEGGTELDLAALPGRSGQLGAHTAPTHLPGSSTWRLPLLSTTSRGGSGCPWLASTPWNAGVLQDTGGQGCRGGGEQALVPQHLGSLDPMGKRDRDGEVGM